jgi:hypothetical protein
VSRTLADLEGKAHVELGHVSEAIQYRTLDRNFWEWPALKNRRPLNQYDATLKMLSARRLNGGRR